MKSVAVDLPSVKSAKAGLKQDADHVESVLDGVDGEVVLVGHSYGGAVVTQAGVHPSVHQLIYVSAFALDEGESCVDNDLEGGEGGSDLDAAIRPGDGVMTLDPELAIPALFADCTEEVARAAVARLRPQAIAGPAGVVTAVAWRHVPATYVVCTEDHAVVPALQRSAAARVRDGRRHADEPLAVSQPPRARRRSPRRERPRLVNTRDTSCEVGQ